jgi:hypothetical protein
VDFTGGECDEDEDDSDILGENNKISSDQVRAWLTPPSSVISCAC